MTSTDDILWVAKTIAGGDPDTTHIIEYQNQFDGRTAWKLCRGEKMYEYAMETGAFIKPRLVWAREDNPQPLVTELYELANKWQSDLPYMDNGVANGTQACRDELTEVLDKRKQND